MKKVKLIISFFALLLVFILSSELFQNYLSTFASQFNYFDLSERTHRKEACSLVEQTAGENGVGVFSVSIFTNTAHSSKIDIYATEIAKQMLMKDYHIKEGLADSLFSGVTQINYKKFSEIADSSSTERYYFTGTIERVRNIRNKVYESYAASYIHKEPNNGVDWLILAVWILIAATLLLLTWFDIQFQKKENFIRVSMGAHCGTLVLKNIIMDMVVLTGVFAGLNITLKQFIYVEYERKNIIIIFLAFLVLNTMLFFTLLDYDYKEVLYGANIQSRTIANCYVLKAVSIMIAIASVSINFGLIFNNMHYLNLYDEIEKYKNFSFISIQADVSSAENTNEKIAIQESIESRVFYDYYFDGKVALATYNFSDKNNRPYLLVNENTTGLENLIEPLNLRDFNGYYIFIPSECENADDIAENAFESTKYDFESFSENQPGYQTVIYNDDIELLYFDSSEGSLLSFGFETEKKPIMIFLNLKTNGEKFENNKESDDTGTKTPFFHNSPVHGMGAKNVYSDAYANMGRIGQDVMYQLTEQDISELQKEYSLENVFVTSVTERCEQYRASMLRVVLLNTIISIFMILLEAAIITTIIRMEYVINAKELAIKKILGYSIWSKNKSIFLLNLLAALIGSVTMITAALMFSFVEWHYIVLCAGAIVILELFLIICYISKIERTSVPRILKGGSL